MKLHLAKLIQNCYEKSEFVQRFLNYWEVVGFLFQKHSKRPRSEACQKWSFCFSHILSSTFSSLDRECFLFFEFGVNFNGKGWVTCLFMHETWRKNRLFESGQILASPRSYSLHIVLEWNSHHLSIILEMLHNESTDIWSSKLRKQWVSVPKFLSKSQITLK